MHFEGFNFHLYLFRLANVASGSAMRLLVIGFYIAGTDDVAQEYAVWNSKDAL